MNLRTATILALLLGLLLPAAAGAGAYMNRAEALELAFPGAERVETVNLFLTAEEAQEVARLSGAPLDSALFTFYVGRRGETVTAYAAIEAATVRTLPETVLVVLDPDGRVRFTEILAFFEPEEYLPPRRWLAQFAGRSLSPELRVGGDIQGITGATLSAQAVTRQVRKTAALVEILKRRAP